MKKLLPTESKLVISTYETSGGWGAVVAGLSGLKEVVLPFGRESRDELVASLAERYPDSACAEPDSVAGEAARRLSRYFNGEKVEFLDLPVDVSVFTPFQREVYRFVAAIPYGKVVTYREVAVALGRPRAARGIGGAMGRNPLPVIIPCHRVVGFAGSMTGYSAPGGTTSKQGLLRLEGVRLTRHGRVERDQIAAFPKIS